MKIKCSFCDTYFDDTKEMCPHCGAPNEGVVRTTAEQPTTIEGLKQWYKDRGLPPAETTRFFIGENYKKPRAFGIYYDEASGNYVVYKNKDSGQRAVRYEGTDEAYAVNELYQRLKQEIIEQKMHNVKKKQNQVSNRPSPSTRKKSSSANSTGMGKSLLFLLLLCGGAIAGIFALIMIIGILVIMVEPKTGYYVYENTAYYRNVSSYNGKYWYEYEKDEWSDAIDDRDMPLIFGKKKTCKPYWISEDWNSSLPCADFKESVCYKDIEQGLSFETGYYVSDGKTYYHFTDQFYQWYVYDKDWKAIEYEEIPYDLQHSSLAAKEYKSKQYKKYNGESDFDNTLFYKDHECGSTVKKGYFKSGNHVYYHLQDDYYDGWYTYDDDKDDWISFYQEDLPEDLQHPSTVNDFYFTPEWNSETQFTDFEDTPLYNANKPSSDSKDNDSDDSDYDWDSGDSWDSGDTDWGSDW